MNSSIRAVIIDDEENGRLNLKSLLEQFCPNVEVVGMAADAASGAVLIRKVKPELAFLDIEMPGGTGFDLLQSLQPVDFAVIFTTAYSEYAVKAFKVKAQDYLLKPIDVLELQQAVERVSPHRGREAEDPAADAQDKKMRRIGLSSTEGYEFFDLDTIIFLRSEGNYTHVHMTNGEKVVVTKKLGEFEEILDENEFCRIHGSHIINLRFVKKYVRGKGGYVEMSDNTLLDVSQRKKKEFLDKITAT